MRDTSLSNVFINLFFIEIIKMFFNKDVKNHVFYTSKNGGIYCRVKQQISILINELSEVYKTDALLVFLSIHQWYPLHNILFLSVYPLQCSDFETNDLAISVVSSYARTIHCLTCSDRKDERKRAQYVRKRTNFFMFLLNNRLYVSIKFSWNIQFFPLFSMM